MPQGAAQSRSALSSAASGELDTSAVSHSRICYGSLTFASRDTWLGFLPAVLDFVYSRVPMTSKDCCHPGLATPIPDFFHLRVPSSPQSSVQSATISVACSEIRLGSLLFVLDSLQSGTLLALHGFTYLSIPMLLMDLALPDPSLFPHVSSYLILTLFVLGAFHVGLPPMILNGAHSGVPTMLQIYPCLSTILMSPSASRLRPLTSPSDICQSTLPTSSHEHTCSTTMVLTLNMTHLDSALFAQNCVQSKSFLSSLGASNISLSPLLHIFAWLGLVVAALGYIHPETSLFLHSSMKLDTLLPSTSCTCTNFCVSALSVARLESLPTLHIPTQFDPPSSMLDSFTLDSPLSARSFSRLSVAPFTSDFVHLKFSLAIQLFAHPGAALTIVNCLHSGTTMVPRSYYHLGMMFLASGISCVGTMAVLLDVLHVDALSSPKGWA